MNELKSVKDWEELREKSKNESIIILKHSSRCPISLHSFNLVKEAEKNGLFPIPINLVIVPENREISIKIAADLDVQHQSPQAIVLKDSKILYLESHREISPEDIVKSIL